MEILAGNKCENCGKNLKGKLMWLPSSLNLKKRDLYKICKLINNFYKNYFKQETSTTFKQETSTTSEVKKKTEKNIQ